MLFRNFYRCPTIALLNDAFRTSLTGGTVIYCLRK